MVPKTNEKADQVIDSLPDSKNDDLFCEESFAKIDSDQDDGKQLCTHAYTAMQISNQGLQGPTIINHFKTSL